MHADRVAKLKDLESWEERELQSVAGEMSIAASWEQRAKEMCLLAIGIGLGH